MSNAEKSGELERENVALKARLAEIEEPREWGLRSHSGNYVGQYGGGEEGRLRACKMQKHGSSLTLVSRRPAGPWEPVKPKESQ